MRTITKSRNNNNSSSSSGDTITSSAVVPTNNKSTSTTTTNTSSNTATTRVISSNLIHVVILISILLAQLQQQQGIMAFRVNISARHQHVFKAHLFQEHASIQLHGQISAVERAFLLQQAAGVGTNQTETNNTLLAIPSGKIDDEVDDNVDGKPMTLTQPDTDNSHVPKDLNVVDEIHTLLNLPKEMMAPAAVAISSKEQEQHQGSLQELVMGTEREDGDDDDDEHGYEEYNYEENNQIYIFENNSKTNDNYYGYKIQSLLIIFVITMNVTMMILYLGLFAMALFLSSEKRVQKIKLTDMYTKI